MPNETINDLRAALFQALRGLTDKENPMDIDRTRAISDVAQTIINTAKVEVEFMRVNGGKGSGFIPDQEALPAPPSAPGLTVRTHRLRG